MKMDIPENSPGAENPPGAENSEDTATGVSEKSDQEPTCTKAELEFKLYLNSLKIKLEDGTTKCMVERQVRDISGKWIYLCYPCGAICVGEVMLQSHISGKKHKMNLTKQTAWPNLIFSEHPYIKSTQTGAKKTPQKVEEVTSHKNDNETDADLKHEYDKYKNVTCYIQKILDSVTTPLLGVEYLIEHPPENKSHMHWYTCTLCDKRGQPRTIVNHLTSLLHRNLYLIRHFPTAHRKLQPLSRIPKPQNAGYNIVLNRLVKRIVDKYGVMRPACMDKQEYEQNKLSINKWLYSGPHFAEKEGAVFEEVIDVDFVKSFLSDSDNTSKSDTTDKVDTSIRSLEKKESSLSSTVTTSKTHVHQISWELNRDECSETSVESRPYNKNRYEERRRPFQKYKDRREVPHSARYEAFPERRSDRSPLRSKLINTTEQKSQGRDYHKWTYKLRIAEEKRQVVEADAKKAFEYHQKNPEKHPLYPEEWKKFWSKRYKEIVAEGRDPSKYDFKPDWVKFWKVRVKEIYDQEILVEVNEIYRLMCLSPPDMTRPSAEKQPKSRSKSPERRLAHKKLSPAPRKGSPGPRRKFVESPKLRSRSPVLRKRSTKLRSRSPVLRKRSPKFRSRSPVLRKRSPKLRSRSPVLRKRSPKLRSRSPVLRKRSPKLRSRSPVLRKRSPKLRSRSPVSGKSSPKLRSRSPVLRKRSPKLRSRSPVLRKRLPKLRSRSPVSDKRSPKLRSRSPVSGKRSPKLRSRSPVLRKRSPELRKRGSDPQRKLSDTRRKSLLSQRRTSNHRENNTLSSPEKTRVLKTPPRSPARSQDDSALTRNSDKGKSAVETVVGTLRMLVALEDYLGSLGPSILNLLTEALRMEKVQANSSEELLLRENAFVVVETATERLKGAKEAGLLPKTASAAVNLTIARVSATLQAAYTKFKQNQKMQPSTTSKPAAVSMTDAGDIDRAQIAQQMAEALIAQGKTDVSAEQLSQLVDTVVDMAETKKREAGKKKIIEQHHVKKLEPQSNMKLSGTTSALQTLQSAYEAVDDKVVEEEDIKDLGAEKNRKDYKIGEESMKDVMDGLTDSDLKTLLSNFNKLSAEEQHSLIAYLTKLESRDPMRVERFREFFNYAATLEPLPEKNDIKNHNVEPVTHKLNPATQKEGPITHNVGPVFQHNDSITDNDLSNNLGSGEDDYTYDEVMKSVSEKVKELPRRHETETVKKSIEESKPDESPATEHPKPNLTNNLSSATDLLELVHASLKFTTTSAPSSTACAQDDGANCNQPKFYEDMPKEPPPENHQPSTNHHWYQPMRPFMPMTPITHMPQAGLFQVRHQDILPPQQNLMRFNKPDQPNKLHDYRNNNYNQGPWNERLNNLDQRVGMFMREPKSNNYDPETPGEFSGGNHINFNDRNNYSHGPQNMNQTLDYYENNPNFNNFSARRRYEGPPRGRAQDYF